MDALGISFRTMQWRHVKSFISHSFLETMGLAPLLPITQFRKLLSIFCIGVHQTSYMQIRKSQFITVCRLLQKPDIKGSVVCNYDAIVHITYDLFMDLRVSRSTLDIRTGQTVNGRGHWFDLRRGIDERMKEGLPMFIDNAY